MVYKKLLYAALTGVVMSSLTGCGKPSKESHILTADLDKAKVVVMNPDDIIWLKTNDSSVIYDISNLSHIGDRMLIQSRSLWKIFTEDGKYAGEVAHKGDAPEDFLWIGNIWNDDSLVYLYDSDLNKIQKYNNEGRYLGYDTVSRDTENFDAHPGEVYITETDGVFYVNSFFGMPPFNKMFSHAPDINTLPKAIEGRRRENGHTFYNRVYIDNPNHRLLHWEHIKDTLFAVTTDEVYPLYIFDYGKNTVPAEITGKQEVVERFLALHELGDNDYAYPMRFFQMYDGLIYFVVPKRKQCYIGCIDENKNEVAYTEFKTPENMKLLPQMFFKIDGDDILLSVIDENSPESNPGLLRFPVSELNKP